MGTIVRPTNTLYFTPLDIPDCVMYLDSDEGITLEANNKISKWEDQSGSGSHGYQSADASRPVYVEDVFNGHAGIQFIGATPLYFTCSGNLGMLRNIPGSTIVAVYQGAGGSNQVIYHATVGTSSNNRLCLYAFASTNNTGQVWAATLDSDGNSSGNNRTLGVISVPVLVSATFNYLETGTITAYLDNIPAYNTSYLLSHGTNTSDTDSTGIRIGQLASSGHAFDGYLAFLGLWKRVLTSAELSVIWKWAAIRYDLMWPICQKMTAANVPSPQVASADSYTGINAPWKAFYYQPDHQWQASGAVPQNLTLDLGTVATVIGYDISNPYSTPAGYSPKDWEFQTSMDGTTYTTRDTQTGNTMVTQYLYKSTNGAHFMLSSPATARYFRLHITATNDVGGNLAVGNFHIYKQPDW